MITIDQLQDVVGSHARTTDGDKLGKVGQVYVDDYSGQPEFATVHTGLFGHHESFVPLARARFTDEGLEVPYDKDTVKKAPKVQPEEHLDPEEERQLFDYYDLPYDVKPGSDDYVTGSGAAEEEVTVVTEEAGPGGVRLRRYVVK